VSLSGRPTLPRGGRGWPGSPFARPHSLRALWPFAALAVITIGGAALHLWALDDYPPEMTSDHVEKVLDALRIAHGYRPVFLAGNGGREPAQFYLLAAAHTFTGHPLDFTMLKGLSAVEGTLGIIAVWWLGRTVMADEPGATGELTGLVAAGLVAIGQWPIMLSRLGLRIVLTPLIVAIVLALLARGLRHQRRGDFLGAGLALGLGLYCYQAVRMLPLLVGVVGVLALLIQWRERGVVGRNVRHFAALTSIAGAVAVPLLHYAAQYPQDFWRRISTRILGDGVLLAPGVGDDAVLHAATATLAKLGGSLWTALLMFNVRGDGSWFNGTAAGAPALDRYTGTLFFLGLIAWGWLLLRRRDPARWLIPLGVPIMLLPTALAFAFPIEIPSATRASGALPCVFVLAAYPVALSLQFLGRRLTALPDRLLTLTLLGLVATVIAQANITLYFGAAMAAYRASTQEHHRGGTILRAFIAEADAPGNAFVVAHPFWWDHRAVAIEAGDPQWDNGIAVDDLHAAIMAQIIRNNGTRYEFRPDRPVLFFINQRDLAVADDLRSWFASGDVKRIATTSSERDFLVLTTQPAGCAWLRTTVGDARITACP
jgi:hypothetical protein